MLEKCDRNKRQACEALGISYHTLNAYLNYQPAEHGTSVTGTLGPGVVASQGGAIGEHAG